MFKYGLSFHGCNIVTKCIQGLFKLCYVNDQVDNDFIEKWDIVE